MRRGFVQRPFPAPIPDAHRDIGRGRRCPASLARNSNACFGLLAGDRSGDDGRVFRPRLALRPDALAAATMWLVVAAAPARAVTPAIVVDEQLRQRTVRVQRLEEGMLSFFDDQRRLVVEPAQRYVQLLVEGAASSWAEDAARVTMTDGRRIVGTWRGADREGEAVRIVNRWVGQVTVPLDDVGRITFGQRSASGAMSTGQPPPAAGWSDRAVLGNGDVLEGFVVGVHDDHVEFQMNDAEATVSIPRANVSALVLAGAPGKATAARPLVGLDDGTLLDFASVRIASDRLIATRRARGETASGPPIVVPMAHVRRIDFDTVGIRLVPLRDLMIQVTGGGGVFGLDRPPMFTATGVMRLHAPLTVDVALPPGARRFAATGRVEEAGEASAWADMRLRVTSSAGAGGTYALSRRRREQFINQRVNGSTLTLVLEPAANGPVMDRLRLVHGTVLVAADTARDADPGDGR